MFETPPRYFSYILRFWENRSEVSSSSDWYFSLEDPEQQARYGFSSLEELVAFLQKRCTHLPAKPPPPGS